jgi:CHAT domain-containing protein
MQARFIMVCLHFAVLIACHSGNQPPQTDPRARRQPCADSSLTAALRRDAYKEYSAGRIQQAAQLYERGYRQAEQAGNPCEAAWNLHNSAACHHLMLHYRKAMRQYLGARPLANRSQDTDMQGMIASNLSSLYLQMGELDLADAEAQTALRLVDARTASGTRAGLYAQAATVLAGKGEIGKALPLFASAIYEADGQDDRALLAKVWDNLGEALRRAGRLAEAEEAIAEAFRIRRCAKAADLSLSYTKLGRLRLMQGDASAAERFLTMALDSAARSAAPMPRWLTLYYRGRSRDARGRTAEALADYRAARDGARAWRLEVLPVDAVRISTDAGLHEIYSAYAASAGRLHLRTGRSDLARESFLAAEENRAASLRESFSDLPRVFPDEYGETLASLRAALNASPTREADASRAAALELRLSEIEARAGMPQVAAGTGTASSSLRSFQARLGPGSGLLSFSLGDQESYMWAVTTRDCRLLRLPAGREIAKSVERFQEALRSGAPAASRLGNELYRMLFGGLPREFTRLSRWKLVLDDALFGLPFAALVSRYEGERPVYLVADHEVEVLPGALFKSVPMRASANLMAAFGDPVYNRADPRFDEQAAKGEAHWPGMLFAAMAPAGLELNRLAGSDDEVAACTRAWKGIHQVRLGGDVNRGQLSQVLATNPEVLHLALHVVRSGGERAGLHIALGLKPDGTQDLLGPEEIRTMRSGIGLVVLSGCSSGWGRVRPDAGVLGLTRAWLQAGARFVAASLWQVPDDDGALFSRFYLHLQPRTSGHGTLDVARALRLAQLDMLRSRSWHSDPRYWAAYFSVSRGLPE